MKILQTELYKIYSRKIIYIGLLAGVLFLGFYFWVSVLGEEYVYEDGTCYRRMEAVEKNKEIVGKYSGPLTREKALDVIAAYGWTVNADELETDPDTGDARKGYYENAVNRFVTERLSTRRTGKEEPKLADDTVIPEINSLMDGTLMYMGGEVWGQDFMEMHLMARLILAVLTVIAIAPVFSEEYSLGTASVLMTTEHGRGQGVCWKAAAGLIFSIVLYVVITGTLFAAFAGVYGLGGLKSSGELIFPDLFYRGTSKGPAGILLLRYLAAGLTAITGTAGITLFISSRCRQTFRSLIWSLAVYLLPLVMYSIVLSMLRMTRVTYLLRQLVLGFTLFFPLMEVSSMPASSRWCEYGLLIGVTVLCIIQGCRYYSKYQVT